MNKEIPFNLDSSEITQVARQKMMSDFDMLGAIETLKSIKPREDIGTIGTIMMYYKILDGQMGFTGIYPGEDIKLQEENRSGLLHNWFAIVKSTIDDLSSENTKFMRLLEICESILSKEELKKINSEIGEDLFCINSNKIIEDIKVRRTIRNEDSGFLDPSGTFHSVDYGNHLVAAKDIAFEEYHDDAMQYKCDCLSKSIYPQYTDFLISKGWCFLHNPDLTVTTVNTPIRLTNAQTNWLFDFYMRHGLEKKAFDLIY